MKIERYKSTSLYRHAATSACYASLAVLLSACGGGTSESQTTNTTPVATGNSSISAAQLAADDTTTLSAAQAAAAGLIPIESVEATDGNSDIVVTNAIDVTDEAVDETGSAPVLGAANAGEETPEPSAPVVTESNTIEPEAVAVEPAPATEPEAVAVESAPATEPAAEVEEPESQAAVSAPAEQTNDNSEVEGRFLASNTDGFVGEVLDDGVVKVNWVKDPTARGYNVFRQAEYVTTVFEEEYIDTDTFDESYYYEIQAFDHSDPEIFNYIARGLTVEVTGTGRINPLTPVPDETILDGYELVFSDEFNGTELDSSKWETSYIWGDDLVINSEEQHYVDIQNKPDFGYNPFSFDGESVTISSIETPDELKDKALGQKYLSGMFTSYDGFSFTYGYAEARVQLPYGKGLWPAFWLLNKYYVDDKPEIDIMEFIGDNQDVAYHTYHYFEADGVTLRSTKSEPSVGVDFTNGWHKFAVEWLPGVLIFYVNDVEKHRIIDSKVSQQEMYIIANTALGGWWPGSPDSTTNFPAEYKIDYIRVYQQAGGPPQSDPTEGLESQLLLWDDVPRASPSHIPSFEDFPEGYPERLGQ